MHVHHLGQSKKKGQQLQLEEEKAAEGRHVAAPSPFFFLQVNPHHPHPNRNSWSLLIIWSIEVISRSNQYIGDILAIWYETKIAIR